MPRNVNPTDQSNRAKQPRPNGYGTRGAHSNPLTVAAAPVLDNVDNLVFSEELVRARQCPSDKTFDIPPEFAANYKPLVAQLIHAGGTDPNNNAPQLMRNLANTLEPAIHIESYPSLQDDALLNETIGDGTISYGQLAKFPGVPDLSLRPPVSSPAPEAFMMFEVPSIDDGKKTTAGTRKFVQAPPSHGGHYYEVVLPQSLQDKVIVEFEIDVGEGESYGLTYYAHLRLGRRTQEQIYINGQVKKERVILLTVGHCDANGKRTSHGTVAVAGKELAARLFDENKWRFAPVGDVARDVEPQNDDEITSVNKYEFSICADQLCYRASQGKDDSPFLNLANFSIPQVMALYQFAETGYDPMVKLLCRLRMRPSAAQRDQVFYLASTDENRSPLLDQYTVLDVEVLVKYTALKTHQEVNAAFATTYSGLQCFEFTPALFQHFLGSMPVPLPSAVIVRWGKQPSGWFVLSNCAFKDGRVCSVADSGHAIAPEIFTMNPINPMPCKDFPKLTLGVPDHLRYWIFHKLFNDQMPRFFANNSMPAKVVLAHTILGMHADECWRGVRGLDAGMSLMWVMSYEQHTGKTTAMTLGQHAIGCGHQPLIGGDATKPALLEALCQGSLPRAVDDMVLGEGGQSKSLQQLSRILYGQAARMVSGKTRTPSSSVIITSNQTPDVTDKAMMSRILVVYFRALIDPEDAYDGAQYTAIQNMLSCLMPDLEQIGKWDGTLDHQAIGDWVKFLTAAIGTKRDRNINEWAKTCYVLTLLHGLAQSGAEELESMFEWIVITTSRMAHTLTNHAGIVDQFIVAILDVQENIQPNLLGPHPDKVLHHHNFRTNCMPQTAQLPGTAHGTWWAIRVGPACNVIKNLTGKSFREIEVYEHATHYNGVFPGKCYFYDHQQNPYPIQHTTQDFETNLFIHHPLPEHELVQGTLTRQRCLWINQSIVDRVQQSLIHGARPDTDYTKIMVTSCNPEQDPYNFVTDVSTRNWWGFRSLGQGTFAKFCGATNLMQVGSDLTSLIFQDGARAVMKKFDPDTPMSAYLNPETIQQYFDTNESDPRNMPPIYIMNPFDFQNGEDDEYEPNPFGDFDLDDPDGGEPNGGEPHDVESEEENVDPTPQPEPPEPPPEAPRQQVGREDTNNACVPVHEVRANCHLTLSSICPHATGKHRRGGRVRQHDIHPGAA
jgi:hypothetical protein